MNKETPLSVAFEEQPEATTFSVDDENVSRETSAKHPLKCRCPLCGHEGLTGRHPKGCQCKKCLEGGGSHKKKAKKKSSETDETGFDSAAFLPLFVLLGSWLEAKKQGLGFSAVEMTTGAEAHYKVLEKYLPHAEKWKEEIALVGWYGAYLGRRLETILNDHLQKEQPVDPSINKGIGKGIFGR